MAKDKLVDTAIKLANAMETIEQIKSIKPDPVNPVNHLSDLLDDTAPYSNSECAVYPREDNVEVLFRLTGPDYKRLKSRMASQDQAVYIWENIIKRAIMAHIY